MINPDYGLGIRWTTVLTNAPFEENKEIMKVQYGACEKCVKACPAQAKIGRNYIDYESRELRLDVRKCEEYYNKLKEEGRLQVWGMCLFSCPFSKK